MEKQQRVIELKIYHDGGEAHKLTDYDYSISTDRMVFTKLDVFCSLCVHKCLSLCGGGEESTSP